MSNISLSHEYIINISLSLQWLKKFVENFDAQKGEFLVCDDRVNLKRKICISTHNFAKPKSIEVLHIKLQQTVISCLTSLKKEKEKRNRATTFETEEETFRCGRGGGRGGRAKKQRDGKGYGARSRVSQSPYVANSAQWKPAFRRLKRLVTGNLI